MVRLSGCIVKQTLFEARKCHLAVCGSTGCSGPFPYRMKKSRFEIRTLLLMRVGIIQVHAMIRYIPVAALAPTCEATLGCMWRPQNLSLNHTWYLPGCEPRWLHVLFPNAPASRLQHKTTCSQVPTTHSLLHLQPCSY